MIILYNHITEKYNIFPFSFHDQKKGEKACFQRKWHPYSVQAAKGNNYLVFTENFLISDIYSCIYNKAENVNVYEGQMNMKLIYIVYISFILW